MADPTPWEEQLFTSNAPLPRRELATDHPMRGLPRQYVDGDQVLRPWTYWALAPVPREWEPLPEHHEAAYLTPPDRQIVRVGLIDYAEGTVVAWRHHAASRAYQPRPTPPRRDPDEPPPDPISRPRRRRRRRPSADTSPPPSRKQTS